MEKQAVVVAECGNCKGKICLIIKCVHLSYNKMILEIL